MNMLENHLQQIMLSAEAIAELPFPPPKMFTNALLHPHDITTLIRDTEVHERALFSVAPYELGSIEASTSTVRSSTVFELNRNGSKSAYKSRNPMTAVGRILGGDLMDQIQKGGVAGNGRDRMEVDVNILLKGAEKLCAVYPIQGAMEKINSLRTRHEHLTASIEHYEARLAKQASQLGRLNQSHSYDDNEADHENEEYRHGNPEALEQVHVTAEDVQREEEEMKELEKKRVLLAARVSGMEKDLGGLLR